MRLVVYKRFGNWILIAGMLLCCLYAVHDMQTAEGVGLYFSMQLGMETRTAMDAAVDVLSIAALAGLVYLPCRMFGHRAQAAYLRLLIGYLAVVPQLSLAQIIALFRPEQRVFMWDMSLGEALVSWAYSFLPFLQIWIPLLLLMYGIGAVNQCFCLEKGHKLIVLCQAVLVLALFVVPSAENLLLYLSGYLGLLIAFDCWEVLLQKLPGIKKWHAWVFALLLLKGIYRIVVLTSLF